MEKNHKGFVYWAPRIMSIIFILFLGLMSLDVFSSELSLGQTLLALFMHNLPALILLVVLIIAWKREIVGGITYILGGLVYIVLLARTPFEWHKFPASPS
jgi:hypothetical protein